MFFSWATGPLKQEVVQKPLKHHALGHELPNNLLFLAKLPSMCQYGVNKLFFLKLFLVLLKIFFLKKMGRTKRKTVFFFVFWAPSGCGQCQLLV